VRLRVSFVERGSMREMGGGGVGVSFGGLSFFFFRSHATGFGHFPASFLPPPSAWCSHTPSRTFAITVDIHARRANSIASNGIFICSQYFSISFSSSECLVIMTIQGMGVWRSHTI